MINRFLSLFFKIKKTIVTETGLTIVQTFERDKITTEHFKQNKLIYKTINMRGKQRSEHHETIYTIKDGKIINKSTSHPGQS